MHKTGSQMLFDSRPLIVNTELAEIIGLNESIVLQQIHYWLQKNQEQGINFYDGRFWVYNTIDDWHQQFKFWSVDTVKRTLKKLRDAGILVTATYNHDPSDRTLWYSIDYEALNNYCEQVIRDQETDQEDTQFFNDPLGQNALMQNAPRQKCKMHQCLNTETNSPESNCLLVSLKNDSQFNHLFNDFCINDSSQYREKTLYYLARCAENNQSSVEDIIDALRVCVEKDRQGQVNYLNGILMNKAMDRAKGLYPAGKPVYAQVIHYLRERLSTHVDQQYLKRYEVDQSSGTLFYEPGENAAAIDDMGDLMKFICQDLKNATGAELVPRVRS